MKSRKDELLYKELEKEHYNLINNGYSGFANELRIIDDLMEGKISKGNYNFSKYEIAEMYCEDLESLYSTYNIK